MQKLDNILKEYLISKITKLDKAQDPRGLETTPLEDLIELWKVLSLNEN